jgi:uncharacterized protein DUF6494
MNEEAFNLEIRRFLKSFGIRAQREIEKAVEAAINSGVLKGQEVLPVRATLTMPGLLPAVHVDGEIALSGQGPTSP